MNKINLTTYQSMIGKISMAVLALSLSACASLEKISSSDNGSAPTETNQFAACYSEAMSLNNSAYISSEKAQYLAAARVLFQCSVVGAESNKEKAMQLHALSTFAFLRAADIGKAQDSLTNFQQRFPEKDLYLQGYNSFIDTVTALIESERLDNFQLSRLNIPLALRKELDRKQHWLTH